jgi:hypothetical protein
METYAADKSACNCVPVEVSLPWHMGKSIRHLLEQVWVCKGNSED